MNVSIRSVTTTSAPAGADIHSSACALAPPRQQERDASDRKHCQNRVFTSHTYQITYE
jgi:hypothetical protein